VAFNARGDLFGLADAMIQAPPVPEETQAPV
jgi:hypothetical protein